MLFIICLVNLTAQNSKRYYPSVKNILNIKQSDKKSTKSFDFYHQWIEKITANFYYKNLQMSTSPRNDSFFYSMDLIVKKENTFHIGNSGIQLILNNNTSDFSAPIPIRMEEYLKLNSYFPSFDINTYDSKNLKQQFEIMNTVLNLNEEEIMAQFINIMVTPLSTKATKFETFLVDLKREGKIKLSKEKYKNANLASIVSEIYNQKKIISSSILFDIYIKSSVKKEESKNMQRFYRNLINKDYSEYISDIVSYQSSIILPKKGVTLAIPSEIIQIVKDTTFEKISDKLLINPSSISINHLIIHEENVIECKIENLDFTGKSNFYYILPNEIILNKHPYLNETNRVLEIKKSNEIKNISLFLRENSIEIKMQIDSNAHYQTIIIYKNDFKL